jgi:hypothetical protein
MSDRFRIATPNAGARRARLMLLARATRELRFHLGGAEA